MLALALAGTVLGAVAIVIARNRRQPEKKPARVEAKDRKDPRRR
ncbi:hypothetical protein BH23PSE1_BH23PSE1_14560 [soil metagenome]